ncbi:hypothetical protein V1478_004763 [Vespula squamosa]|uniref:Uncharacterized protein n=1 Tax=Vespula squamosa TaxID=30214 RepID=A0ABD2BHF4_VESSQ
MDVLIASWIPRYQFLDITHCSSKEEIFSVVISFHFFDTVKVKNSLRKIVTHALHVLLWRFNTAVPIIFIK